MITMGEIRNALAERMAQAGLRTYARPPEDGIGNELPAAYVRSTAGDFLTTFGGQALDSPMDGEMVVVVVVSIKRVCRISG